MSHKKLSLAIAVISTLGMAPAMAARVAAYQPISSVDGNFSMLSPAGTGATAVNPNYDPNATSGPNTDPYLRGGAGYVIGGTNNVTFAWDGTLFNSSSDYTGLGSVSNASIASTFPFYTQYWTAHTVQIFGPGSYTFDTTAYNGGDNNESGLMTMTVGANQIGMHMLFNWGYNFGIDMVNVWNINTTFSNCASSSPVDALNGINCLWSGPANAVGNTANTIFTLASTDNDGDGTLGIPTAADGLAFPGGYNANFNLKGTLTAVPIPGAVWLFGSGLLGLLGVARRRNA